MKTEVKKLEKCQVELKVVLEKEESAEAIRSVEKVFAREAQLPGFRKGKVPMAIIRREFAEGLSKEVSQAMLRMYYPKAVKEAEIAEVALTEVKDLTCTEEKGEFTAVVDIKPEFKVPTYKGLKIDSKDTTVSDEAVAEQIERLRVAYAKYETAKEGESVAVGDYAQIDYSGTVDGKPILEINSEAKVVAGGQGFWTQIEEGRFLPEILKALEGMKVGETKEKIKAKFDKNSAPEGLKGAKAEYTVTLKSFRRRILPTDAELAERAKVDSLDKLTANVREAMEKAAVEQEKTRRESMAVELLLKKAAFDVPGSQVSRARDAVIASLAQRFQESGVSSEYITENKEKILADANESATRQVRLWYIIDAIATAEKIEGADDEKGQKVVEFILANAKN